jgi:hypothetical protein
MAELAIISETGMFHSVCRCTFGANVEWYGFAPVESRSPRGQGSIHREDRSRFINHIITFAVDDFVLTVAIGLTVSKYSAAEYILSYRDCVSFSADMARHVGLAVPMINMTPFGLIEILRVNPHKAFR